MEIRLSPRINFAKTHTTAGFFPSYTRGQYSPLSVPHQPQPLIFTPSSHWVPPLRFHFFETHTTITYVTTNHTRTLYFLHIRYSNAVTIFETSPYLRQYHLQIHSATSPRQEHISILVKFLKIFFSFFSTQYGTQRDTAHRQILIYPLLALVFICSRKNKFFLFIINLRILNFSQVGFSLRFIQVPQHLGLPQHLPTPPTNNTIILLPNLTGKKSASLEYLIGNIIIKIEFQQIYLAHYQPKNFEMRVQPCIKAQYNKI